jgi:2-methylcitrate dehydratase PrpD
VFVGPAVPRIARYTHPATPLEAKFSVAYCVALGLLGRSAGIRDFDADVVDSAAVRALLDVIEVVPTEGRKMIDAGIEVTLDGGEVLRTEVPLARGHPGRPLAAGELRDKFMSLAEPVIGSRAGALHALLQAFPGRGVLRAAIGLVRDGRGAS